MACAFKDLYLSHAQNCYCNDAVKGGDGSIAAVQTYSTFPVQGARRNYDF